MIISHKHKFIFLHCRKAAGSSIAVSLSRYLGPKDLQFSGVKDLLASKLPIPRGIFFEACRHASASLWLKLLVGRKDRYSFTSDSIRVRYAPLLGPDVAHAHAEAVERNFSYEWRNYMKFCVVRNPWSKTVSDYLWRSRRVETPPSFETFIRFLDGTEADINGFASANHDNSKIYFIDDKPAVDRVIRFEELEVGLRDALSCTTLNWDGWLPKSKQSSVSGVKDYRTFYNQTTKDKIRKIYQREIDYFGYTF